MAETGKEAHAPRAIAERRDFVHVEPDAVKRDTLVVPRLEFLGPPALSVRREPVGEDGVARPHLSDVLGPVGVLDEGVAVWMVRQWGSGCRSVLRTALRHEGRAHTGKVR